MSRTCKASCGASACRPAKNWPRWCRSARAANLITTLKDLSLLHLANTDISFNLLGKRMTCQGFQEQSGLTQCSVLLHAALHLSWKNFHYEYVHLVLMQESVMQESVISCNLRKLFHSSASIQTFWNCCHHLPQEDLFGTPWTGMAVVQQYKGSCVHHMQATCGPRLSLCKASPTAP
jgi:hypothetical protein